MDGPVAWPDSPFLISFAPIALTFSFLSGRRLVECGGGGHPEGVAAKRDRKATGVDEEARDARRARPRVWLLADRHHLSSNCRRSSCRGSQRNQHASRSALWASELHCRCMTKGEPQVIILILRPAGLRQSEGGSNTVLFPATTAMAREPTGHPSHLVTDQNDTAGPRNGPVHGLAAARRYTPLVASQGCTPAAQPWAPGVQRNSTRSAKTAWLSPGHPPMLCV